MNPTLNQLYTIHRKLSPLDLRLLVQFVTAKSAVDFVKNPDYELTDQELKQLELLVEKVSTGYPVAYILGEKEFFGRTFVVNEAVLIPRPESEGLIELAISQIKSKNSAKFTLLEIGTGSGALVITLALELAKLFPEIQLQCLAFDISPAALQVAKTNCQYFALNNLEFRESDLLSALLPGERYFDLIIANLPYLKEDDPLPKFEPKSAFVAGSDGLDLYRRLFRQLQELEVAYQDLICEIGYDQEQGIKAVAAAELGNPGQVLNDLANLPRIFHFNSK
ncbi:peptide chain release factor N(5)-glutamine methyltransferase [Candidatus Gracilibacteria bacterium]|jgi:release factor glutamine methyltransferase|nr:peptide chain release factor N(5)-glutamine methyltransferase [Candidatus Gracilibacteria bacterium]